ncbi:hypothetical protein ACFL04_01570 [Patescibacteria group bacterium]
MNQRAFTHIVAVIFIAVIAAGAVGAMLWFKTEANKLPTADTINTFDKCVAAGYPVNDEQSPWTCVANGQTYTQTLEGTTVPEGGPSEADLGLYADESNGFSIRLPQYFYVYAGSCGDDGHGNFSLSEGMVSSLYLDDANTFYITRDHYFELTEGTELPDGSMTFAGCQRINVDLADVTKESYFWDGWKLDFADVSNDEELDSFIKSKWGEGCSLGSQTAWDHQAGVFDVTIEGDELDLDETKCPVNYVYQLLYHPGLGKAVGWNLGQEPYFWAVDPADFASEAGFYSYDESMVNSFRFLMDDEETGTTNTNTAADEVATCTDGWSTYTNNTYNYSVMHPPTSTITLLEENAFSLSPDEVAAGMTFADKFAVYGNELCVKIYINNAAYVSISAPENNAAGVICQRSGVGVIIDQIPRTDALNIDGASYTGTGNIYVSEDPATGLAGTTLMYKNETNHITLADGTSIEYGSTPDESTLYTDYEPMRDTLKCILESYTSVP